MRDAAGAWRIDTPVTNAGGRRGRVCGSIAVGHPCRFVYFVEWTDAPGLRCAVAATGLRPAFARLVPYVRRSTRPNGLHKVVLLPAVLHDVGAQKVANDFDDERRHRDPRARRR